MKISGTTALVTGGASGLGLATIARLASEGARVIAVDLPQANLTQLNAVAGDVEFAGGDVTDEDSVLAAVRQANRDGNLAIVVNCAGIANGFKTAGSKGPFPLEKFGQAVSVNLIGTFNVVRLAAQEMLRNEPQGEERGVIINTASVAAYDGQMGQAAYSASKGGVVAMTLPIARDLASSLIRVMTIAPGTMETPMIAAMPDAVRESLAQQVPHPSRLGRPSEFADLVDAIVRNPLLNGEVIRLDGAIRMAPR